MNSRIIALLSVVLLSCEGGGGGTGSVHFTTWGEDYIEVEIPDGSSSGEGFVDGWSLSYDKFLIVLGDAYVGDGGTLEGTWVFDMTLAGPHDWGTVEDIDARRWLDVGVDQPPAGADTQAGNCTAADLSLMQDGGYAAYVEGTATNGSDTITFAWGFTAGTSFSECHSDEHGDGVVVPDGGTETVQFTIHGDHFFYDDLQSEDPSLRFQAIADADDGDGDVTLEELAAVDLTSLPVGTYGTGGDGTVTNLRQFLEALSHTLVHYRGEGHCHSHL
jgi:hypothetical protein